MNEPTDSDHQHIAHIRREFDELMEQKYLLGIVEHGGHLWEKPVDREAVFEAIDQVVYLITLRDQIDQVCDQARGGIQGDMDPKAACKSILVTLGRVADVEPVESNENPDPR
jgi:hypothetical protein